jgi:hypothetical protein
VFVTLALVRTIGSQIWKSHVCCAICEWFFFTWDLVDSELGTAGTHLSPILSMGFFFTPLGRIVSQPKETLNKQQQIDIHLSISKSFFFFFNTMKPMKQLGAHFLCMVIMRRRPL